MVPKAVVTKVNKPVTTYIYPEDDYCKRLALENYLARVRSSLIIQ